MQSATGAARHVRPRSALASSLKGFSHCAVHPGHRPVSFLGSGDPHVFPAQSGVPGIFHCARLNWFVHGRAGRELVVGSSWLSHFTPSVKAVFECRWYEFPEDSCEDTEGEEGHCIHGQITDNTAIANTTGLRAEGRWPWILSLVAFLAGREWFDERVVRVVFCVTSLGLVSFFSPRMFLTNAHADT